MIRLIPSLAAAAALMISAATASRAEGDITVGYFLKWPMPFQFAKAEGSYDAALGTQVNWRAFDTGASMSAAMAAGEVQIAVSQGLRPFVEATSAGQDLRIIDVAVSYPDNENCVIAAALDIGKDTAADLHGKKVAVPFGTSAYYGFLLQMAHFSVDTASLQIEDMGPREAADALATGAVDMACGWGGALRRMQEHGTVLLTGDEKAELGLLVFDVTSAPAAFVVQNPETIASFLRVTAQANALWANRANRAAMLPVIAGDADMDDASTQEMMSAFAFLSVNEQLSAGWLGGGVQDFMKGLADIYAEAGSIDSALDSYAYTVDVSGLIAIK